MMQKSTEFKCSLPFSILSSFLPPLPTCLLAYLHIYIYITFTYIITYLFTYLLGGSGSGQTTLSCKDIYDADHS